MKKAVRAIIAVATAIPALAFLFTALSRRNYPFELEWMEGAMLDVVRRIMAGKPIYTAPSLDFVPFIYPPLYWLVGGAASLFLGLGLPTLRTVSLLATIGTSSFLGLWVFRETGSRYWSWVSGITFLGTFGFAGYWMDLARVDSLSVFMTVLGLFLLRRAQSVGLGALAGMVLAAAVHAKQTAAIAALPILLFGWSCGNGNEDGPQSSPGRIHAGLLAGFGLGLLVPGIWWTWRTEGWYWWFVYSLPRLHEFEFIGLLDFFLEDLIPLGTALILGVVFFARSPDASRCGSRTFAALSVTGLIGAAWQSYLHLGSYRNVLLPACAALSLLGGLGGHSLETSIEISENSGLPRQLRLALAGRLLLIAGFLVQAWRLWFAPFPLIPGREDETAGRRFLEMLNGEKGRVLLPYHGGYLPMAGKEPCAHHMAICDVLRAGASQGRAALLADIHQALAEGRFSALITDEPWFPEQFDRFFPDRSEITNQGELFLPPVGMRVRPTFIARPLLPASRGNQ